MKILLLTLLLAFVPFSLSARADQSTTMLTCISTPYQVVIHANQFGLIADTYESGELVAESQNVIEGHEGANTTTFGSDFGFSLKVTDGMGTLSMLWPKTPCPACTNNVLRLQQMVCK